MKDSQFSTNGRPERVLSSLVEPMLRELSRWTERLPDRLTADRWQKWARFLGSRHCASERIAGFTRMILARRSLVERILRERWLSSINLYPTLNLSLPQRLQLFQNFHARSEEVTNPGRSSNNAAARHSRAEQIALKHYRQGFQPLVAKDQKMSRAQHDSEAPLRRVFLRSTTVEPFQRARVPTSLPAESSDTTQRIIRNSRKLEQRVWRSNTDAPLLVVKQTMPSTLTGYEDKCLDDDGPRTRGTREPFSEMEVDELTNQVIRQIDRRTTAWRERMGKT